jgi:hypothetical protein
LCVRIRASFRKLECPLPSRRYCRARVKRENRRKMLGPFLSTVARSELGYKGIPVLSGVAMWVIERQLPLIFFFWGGVYFPLKIFEFAMPLPVHIWCPAAVYSCILLTVHEFVTFPSSVTRHVPLIHSMFFVFPRSPSPHDFIWSSGAAKPGPLYRVLIVLLLNTDSEHRFLKEYRLPFASDWEVSKWYRIKTKRLHN